MLLAVGHGRASAGHSLHSLQQQLNRHPQPTRLLLLACWHLRLNLCLQAPEVMERCYGPPADIWSVGVVIYLMIAGCLPFNGSTDRQIIKAVMDSEPDFEAGVWGSVSAQCKAFLRRMLCKNPSQRASIQQLLSHPWLAGNSCSSSCSAASCGPQLQQQPQPVVVPASPRLAPVAVAAGSRSCCSSRCSSPSCSPRSSSGGGCSFYHSSSSSSLGRSSCPGYLQGSPRGFSSSRLVMMSHPGSGLCHAAAAAGCCRSSSGCGGRNSSSNHQPGRSSPAACRLGSSNSSSGGLYPGTA